jgi:hypothetical protein
MTKPSMYDGVSSQIRYPWGPAPFARWVGYDQGHLLAPVRYTFLVVTDCVDRPKWG